MNKLLFFITFATTITFSRESPEKHSALIPRIEQPLIQYPFLGIKIGAASGCLCALVDRVTDGSLCIFTWIGSLSLRALIINDYLKNDPAFKKASSLYEKKEIVTITAHFSAWVTYCIVKNLIR